ncbi:MAG TPA: MarR family winged helix-turn-helix transcriptional regulator [Chloroflexota bacterium]|nr:MarR family winged helix-turn-helix transcriptional regulator [Chloroflexota bacterium]
MPTHYRGDEKEVLALDAFIKLTRAMESVGSRLFACGCLGDLTTSQFSVLEALYHLGPMNQTEVSSKLLKSTSNMVTVIDNLENRGLVRRQRDQRDRRSVVVILTDSGSEVIARVLPLHVEAIVKEMSVLTPGEQRELGRLCRKLGKRETAPESPDSSC